MITAAKATPASAATTPVRDYVSWSAISLYQSCPLRYYFRYIAGLPERTVSASLVFGAAIHRAVEHHFNELLAGNEPPNIESLVGEYDRHWADIDLATVQFGKGDDRESLEELARRMLGAFQGSTLAQPGGHVIGVEETLRGRIVAGVPDVVGRVDLLVESADELVLTDLKTSRSRWSVDQVEDAGPQLLLYSDLVQQLVPGKRLRLRLGVITKAKEPAVELHEVAADPQQIIRTKRVVARVWRAIAAGHFYPSPSPLACGSCPYREPCREWTG